MKQICFDRDRFKLTNPISYSDGQQRPHFRSRYYAGLFRQVGEVIVRSPVGVEPVCYMIISELDWLKFRAMDWSQKREMFES